MIVPTTEDESDFILGGGIYLLCVCAFLIRNYFNCSWYLYLIKNEDKKLK